MSNPFSSAMNYLSGHGGGGGVSEGGNRFVGQNVDLGGSRKLKVKKVIAEGGYGYVFVAQDTQTGKDYALKRQVVSKENITVIKKEIAFLKLLGDHTHIISYVASAGIPPSETSHGNAEFLIQTELCDGGRLEEVVRRSYLNPKQVLRVFYATCSAVAYMHSLQPPIVHRDLKVENLLLDSEGVIKLCDFGSATTQQLNPDSSWTAVQRGLAEDEIQRNTTPMYRSPEMVDLYSNQLVSEKADIWALGCLLYLLCFRTHPFEDSGKLRIINANYKIPEEDTTYSMFHPIIRSCLVVGPAQRPSVDAILAQLYNVSDQLGENMEAPSVDLLTLAPAREPAESGNVLAPGEESDRGSAMTSALQSTSQQAQKLFGFMKDGAGSLFKNIKESSSKAISAMSTSVPKRSGLDLTYITSRIIAMSYPHEDAFHSHHISEVRNFLDERHPSAYLVFNLSGNGYDVAKLNNQVYDFAWPQRGVPDMEKLVDLCRSMDAWLRADNQNVLVVHCHDGVSITPIAIVSYLMFVRALSSPTVGLKYVAVKRKPESPKLSGTPSQLRYLQQMGNLVGQPPYKPHPRKLTLIMLRLSTVPLFNAIRTGCKPFVEVYQEGDRVYTSASNETMDSIRSFHSEDGSVEVPLGVTVQGNIVINIHHIRAIPVARKAGMGMTAVKMFYLHLHTGFLDTQTTSFKFDRKNLDGSSVRKQDKFPSPFHATVEVEWDESAERGVYREASWQNLPYPKTSPLSCFSTLTEQEEVMKQLDPKASLLSRVLPEVPTTPTSPTSDILHLEQNPNFIEEESSSAGSGALLDHSPFNPPAPSSASTQAGNAGKGFFAQLDWQEHQQNAKSAGYVPYQDHLPEGYNSASSSNSGSSDSSSESSEDEFSQFQAGVGGHGHVKLQKEGAGSRGGSGVGGGEGRTNPQIKLIEFGFERSEGQRPPPSQILPSLSNPAPYVDPFHQNSSPSTASSDLFGGTSTDTFGEVVFDPFGGLSTVESRPDQNAGLGDLLGLGSDKDVTPTPSFSTFGSQGGLLGKTPAAENLVDADGTGTGDIFDPFGSISDHQATGPSSQLLGGNGIGAAHDLLGDSPTLMPLPTLSTPANYPSHRRSEPFVMQSDVLAPSTSELPRQSRKLSSPTPGAPLSHTTKNMLNTGFFSTVSHSHPNLASLGDPRQPSQGGRGSGIGGSASHNTSPRRSPSPVPQSSSSTGNIAQQQQSNQFDPFGQFGLNAMVGGAKSAVPGNGSTAHSSKPPTGNTYQPHYMQDPSQHRNGMQPSASSNSTHSQAAAGIGSKPKAASTFRTRPQSPNYNPSLFSAAGNRTGMPSKPRSDAFGDLLGSNFTPKSSNESKTLKDMKSEDGIENALDPDRAKVAAWADRKERNIRAIISSLHEILWEGETRWKEVGIHQLVQSDQVKKFYRKACLSVHPDKAQDSDHEKLARAIFDELNDAYEKFEESGARALY